MGIAITKRFYSNKKQIPIADYHGTYLAYLLEDIRLIMLRHWQILNHYIIQTVAPPMRFKKQNTVISIVENETLHFVEIGPRGKKKAVESVKLADLLVDDADTNIIPFPAKNRANKLLIAPDYWFGNLVCKFQSIKKSLADAFVERKLHAQFEQLPDVKNFFETIAFQREHKERWLYAYFLQDPQFFQLYKSLSRLGLTPQRITSPALIWQSKIRQKMPDFEEGGKCFIELLDNIYHLYFFFEGNFLFSRSIPLADLPADSPDNLQAITYELNQSLYLFSQRAKTEVNNIYLLSSETVTIGSLSEALGREINDLSSLFGEPRGAHTCNDSTGLIDGFVLSHFLLKNQFLFVSHKKLKKELEWRPVQSVGIAIAILLCVLLGMESIFLHKWSRQNQVSAIHRESVDAGNTKQKIRQYNEALDTLIEDADRRRPKEVIAKIARSLPLQIRMQEIFFKIGTVPELEFQGVAKVLGSELLKGSLSVLIANLNKNLHPRRPLTIPDIDIELDKKKKSYLIKFKVEM